MDFIVEVRPSDSPYVETVMRGQTAGNGSTIRPAEFHWHMVLVTYQGKTQFLIVGPPTSAGVLPYIEGVELLWIKFKPSTFMPHLPTTKFLNSEVALPEAAGQSFWLKGSAWQFPDFENADTFVDQLARQRVLAHDPVVSAALKNVASRTVRHRFSHVTGQTHSRILQIQRAQQAAARLRQGSSILDAVHENGYYDQPHLTRSLKRWIGHTPAQIVSARETV